MGAKQRAQPRTRIDPHLVPGMLGRRTTRECGVHHALPALPVTAWMHSSWAAPYRMIGSKCSSADDVQHLHPAADAQERNAPPERFFG